STSRARGLRRTLTSSNSAPAKPNPCRASREGARARMRAANPWALTPLRAILGVLLHDPIGHITEPRLQLAFAALVVGQKATGIDRCPSVWNRNFKMDMFEHGAADRAFVP